MSDPMRLLDTGPMSARRNIALTAALVELHRAGQIPDTLRLSHYPRAVLVGRDQTLAEVYKVRACVDARVEMARRTICGSAVYASPGVLVWEIVADGYRFGESLPKLGERICAGMAAGLARFGLPARLRPLDEVEIGGRTICAASGEIDGPSAVFQGTVLIDLDASEVEAIARLSPSTRAAALSDWLGRVPSAEELKGLLVAGLSHCWRREFVPDAPSRAEMMLADRLLSEGVGSPRLATVRSAAAKAAVRSASRAAERAHRP